MSTRAKDTVKSRGRPKTYVWKEGEDDKLSETERRLKLAVERRRERQKKSYYKKKEARQKAARSSSSGAHIPDSLLDDFGLTPTPIPGKQRDKTPLVVVRDYYGY